MRLRIAFVMVAALAAGFAVCADDNKDKKPHKCPLESIMCPFHGDCEGECRKLCDKGGEALVAMHVKVAAAVKAETKKDANAHVAGTCRAAGCKECASLNEKVFGPALKARISKRMGEMNKEVKHTVKDAAGKEHEVECTFLTGKLCDACVDEMSKTCLDTMAKTAENK
ncbi:MAG: hypothetical protein K8T20_18560 [Planctomycetes bacterium]|nr:hypothetical protein [Planctomycetota bacterium]